jgi:hypothetical protein
VLDKYLPRLRECILEPYADGINTATKNTAGAVQRSADGARVLAGDVFNPIPNVAGVLQSFATNLTDSLHGDAHAGGQFSDGDVMESHEPHDLAA